MISITNLTKIYPARGDAEPVLAIDDLSLSVAENEFLTVLGPSGCGKTTLLKILAGLVPWNTGEITIDGVPVDGPGDDRAMVFQSFALLPWASVLDNVAFGLMLRKVPRAERYEQARAMIRTVGLARFEKSLPRELSGGMQQRVGLARAMVMRPKVLLMDEPFSALDEQTRRYMQEELLGMWEAHKTTVIFITHSMEEAVFLGDRVVLLEPSPGRLHKIYDVPLARPRHDVEEDPEFGRITSELWRQIRAMSTVDVGAPAPVTS
ncbi:ABC transporter ATP-binding protein [Jiangella mangrovi]|uniref:ABC-type nitrate/sulfonate/bicarbonate transport system ATPase subunit n=1 Tax=Jiangella mangrovi TaxID=1524084 RepID=A0A7W9GSZ9_9ACTN|nr:ABC transporter ATP-binding protein [Jiangella mangrovi]MBB5789499.1 ABC-type nitrate/sulfonate/bicarbonate transport system ATPase subunit [Jiangella mangrovi]